MNERKNNGRHHFRNDLILIISVLLLSAIALVYLFVFRKEGNFVKVTVDGKEYDTDTTEYVGRYKNTPYHNDTNFYEETLYRKKTGEFFLYGQGNSASKYAYISPGGRRSFAQRIVPLTDEKAKVWMQQHGYGEKCAALFG